MNPSDADVLGADVARAVWAVRARERRVPEVALVLGSGLGALADRAEAVTSIPAAAIPGYPRTTVPGHRGRLVFGRIEGCEVVFVQGRLHLYEGYGMHAVTFPVRLLHGLGVRRLLVTNAAGGIHPLCRPGTLMLIEDHINFAFAGPLVAPAVPDYPVRSAQALRSGGWAAPYDPEWLEQAEQVALREGIATRRGVYLWTGGPSYETPAEIRMFARLGADAVGMSTVPEVMQAWQLGMQVLGISTITNRAAGLGARPLAHEDVLAVGKQVEGTLEHLVRSMLRENERPRPAS